MFGEILTLFASTEIFIYVFMEIVTKLESVQRVLFRKASIREYAIFVVIFGLFSIFGTYIGIPWEHGAISNIRDLAPMVAGLVAGPYIGVAVGLIGGIHRLFLGGDSAVACCIATILAGFLAGMVNRFLHGKLPGIVPAMIFAVGIELLHGALALALIQPFSEAVEIVVALIPAMIIANSLGLAISIIVLHDTKEPEGAGAAD